VLQKKRLFEEVHIKTGRRSNPAPLLLLFKRYFFRLCLQFNPQQSGYHKDNL
jgi:hypothetical protein